MEKRTLIIIFAILLLFGVGGLGAYLTMRQEGEKEEGEEGVARESAHDAIVSCFCEACGGCERSVGDRGKLIDVTYQRREVDLNEDGYDELIIKGVECVYESGVSPMGGVIGNNLFCILQFRNNEWVEIGFFAGRTYFLKETKTKGYRDIVSQEDIGGAGCLISTSYFKWDGSCYTLVNEKEENRCE